MFSLDICRRSLATTFPKSIFPSLSLDDDSAFSCWKASFMMLSVSSETGFEDLLPLVDGVDVDARFFVLVVVEEDVLVLPGVERVSLIDAAVGVINVVTGGVTSSDSSKSSSSC